MPSFVAGFLHTTGAAPFAAVCCIPFPGFVILVVSLLRNIAICMLCSHQIHIKPTCIPTHTPAPQSIWIAPLYLSPRPCWTYCRELANTCRAEDTYVNRYSSENSQQQAEIFQEGWGGGGPPPGGFNPPPTEGVQCVLDHQPNRPQLNAKINHRWRI